MKIRNILVRLTRNWPAKIISLAAAVLLFLFYQVTSMEERFFSVPVVLELNEGFVPSSPYPKSARVILRGKEESIFLIEEDDIEVYVDLSAHNTEGLFRAPLEYQKLGMAQRIDPLEIRIEPSEATIELERKMTKTVEVVPSVRGFPEKGYELSQYFTVPEFVEIEGPRSHVAEVENVQTEEVNLSGRSEDFSVRLMIESTDPYITFRGGDVIEFVGVVSEAVMMRTYDNISIRFQALDESLELDFIQIRGTAKVQGTQLFLEGFDDSQLRFTVDCSRITEPGRYEMPVVPVAPPELLVLSYEPEVLELDFRAALPGREYDSRRGY